VTNTSHFGTNATQKVGTILQTHVTNTSQVFDAVLTITKRRLQQTRVANVNVIGGNEVSTANGALFVNNTDPLLINATDFLQIQG
jgi:hypothetical protein